MNAQGAAGAAGTEVGQNEKTNKKKTDKRNETKQNKDKWYVKAAEIDQHAPSKITMTIITTITRGATFKSAIDVATFTAGLTSLIDRWPNWS